MTVDAMNYWDQNGDGQIDYTDGWTEEDMEALMEYCDYNDSGVTDGCELH